MEAVNISVPYLVLWLHCLWWSENIFSLKINLHSIYIFSPWLDSTLERFLFDHRPPVSFSSACPPNVLAIQSQGYKLFRDEQCLFLYLQGTAIRSSYQGRSCFPEVLVVDRYWISIPFLIPLQFSSMKFFLQRLPLGPKHSSTEAPT